MINRVMEKEQTIAHFLFNEFYERKQKDPQYTQKQFSGFLKISASRLNHIFAGRHGLSRVAAKDICVLLGCSEAKTTKFLRMVEVQLMRSESSKAMARTKFQAVDKNIKEISAQDFSKVSDWYFFAIMEFLLGSPQGGDIKAVSRELNIHPDFLKDKLDLLLALCLIKQKGDKYFHLHSMQVEPSEISNKAVQNFHEQVLTLAKQSVKKIPAKSRELSSGFIMVTDESFASFRQDIREFVLSMNEKYSENSSTKTKKLHSFGTFLFPVHLEPK